MIQYKGNTLSIEIEKTDPAVCHSDLLRGLATAIRLSMLIDDGNMRTGDRDSLIPLVDMLVSLIPDEYRLEKVYGGKE